jgi:hypothetical protein
VCIRAVCGPESRFSATIVSLIRWHCLVTCNLLPFGAEDALANGFQKVLGRTESTALEQLMRRLFSTDWGVAKPKRQPGNDDTWLLVCWFSGWLFVKYRADQRTRGLTAAVRCSTFVLMEVETLGVARSLGWKVHMRCANGYRQETRSMRRCVYRRQLDLETLVCTRGPNFSLSWPESTT